MICPQCGYEIVIFDSQQIEVHLVNICGQIALVKGKVEQSDYKHKYWCDGCKYWKIISDDLIPECINETRKILDDRKLVGCEYRDEQEDTK